MGTVQLEIWLPVSAEVFGAFLAIFVLLVLYWVAKFVRSLFLG